MDFSVINLELVATLLLLLLIGIGPKIALVPFLEKTKKFAPEQQCAIGRRMVITAVVAAVAVFITGGLLLRLLHITTGAVAVAGGIILALLAVKMALGSEEVVEGLEAPADPDKLAVYPLAIPYLFNPVGITVLIIASESVHTIAAAALVLGLVLLVGAFDYLIFSNIDKIAKRINPTSLIVSEIVFGVLLTAVAVQLFVLGLRLLGIIESAAAH
jgi:multiple antibiotic resistance protein